METDESGLPRLRVLTQPDAAGGHIPTSRSAVEPVFRERHGDLIAAALSPDSPPLHALRAALARPVSISLPASLTGFDVARTEAEFPRHAAITDDAASPVLPLPLPPRDPITVMPAAFEQPEKVVFRSQPILAAAELPNGRGSHHAHDDGSSHGGNSAARMPRSKTRRDTSYDSFKTWSGKLEKQITTHLRGVRPPPPPQEGEPNDDDDGAATSGRPYSSSLPRVQRFFAALEGPELDKLRLTCCRVCAVPPPPPPPPPVVGGAGPAVRQDVAVPPPVPGVRLRHVPRHEQPGHPVEEHRHLGVHAVPPHHAPDQPRALVRLRRAHVRRLRALRLQDRLLLRGRAARVLPSDPRKLLLRAVDRLPLPGHRRAGAGGGEPPALGLVHAHGPHRVPRAQDLRPVDIRRPEAALQGGQPVQPPLHRRQLRRRAARRHHGTQGRAHLLLRRRARALHRALRHAVPEAPHQRDAAEGPPPGVLPLRGRAQRRLPRLGADHRRVRLRLPHRLLHRHVPLRVAGCADQHVQGVQVLAGVVGVHVPDDERGDRGDTLLVGGEERLHAVHVHRAVRGGHAHRDGALPHHAAPRGGAPGPLPQRHLHRHHGAQAQGRRHHRGAPRAAPRQGRRRRRQGPGSRRHDGIILATLAYVRVHG